MSKIVFRDAFDEAEIERYQEIALHALIEAEPEIAIPHEESSGDSSDLSNRGAGTADVLVPQGEVDAESGDVVQSPEDLLLTARQEAEAILTQAREQAEAARQEAMQQGRAQGLEEGRQQSKAEFLPALVAFAQAGQSLLVLEEQLFSQLTPELVRLGLAIAEKIIGKQVAEDPDIIATVLERARAELPHANQVRIWLHPEDYQLLSELRPDLVSIGEIGGRRIEVCETPDLVRGGCRVETEMGVVDASLPVQLQEIGRQLLDEETREE